MAGHEYDVIFDAYSLPVAPSLFIVMRPQYNR